MQKHFLIKAAQGTMKTVEGAVDPNHPLKKLLQELPQNYSVSLTGEVDFVTDVRILVKDENRGNDLDCGTLGNPNVASLLQAASPSSFGKGVDTVYDENVRKGKEIKSDRMQFLFGGAESLIRKK
jgi:hypothetical protein